MDVLALPGNWITAEKDLEFEIYSLSEENKKPNHIKILAGQKFQVYAAIKSAYGNSKLIVINYEKGTTIPVEFDPKYWKIN